MQYLVIICLEEEGTFFDATSLLIAKGQTNLKLFFQADAYSKKWTNKFNFTTCRLVFFHFLEESEDTKKIFRNYLTFSKLWKLTMCLRKYGNISFGENSKLFPNRRFCQSYDVVQIEFLIWPLKGHWWKKATDCDSLDDQTYTSQVP